MSRYRQTMADAYGVVVENTATAAQVQNLKKAYADMKGKTISLDNAKKLQQIFNRFDSNKELLKQLYKADIPFVSAMASARLISKHAQTAQMLMQIRKEGIETAIEELKQINDGPWSLDEGKMSQIDQMQKDGASAEEIAKKLKLKVSIVKGILGEKRIQPKKMVEEETLVEFTSQQIKQAYGILNDPRYKGGNYSGAVAAIEKLAKGLSKHPDVANALKRANESVEHDSAFAISGVENNGREELDEAVGHFQKFMITYGKPGGDAMVYYTDYMQDLQNRAQEYRKKGYIIGKMGRSQPLNQLPKKMPMKGKDIKEEMDKLEINEGAMDAKKFDSLKTGQELTITYNSTMSGTTVKKFVVKSKSRSAKHNVDKVKLEIKGQPGRVPFYLYKRANGSVSLAMGDMAATLVSIKESISEKFTVQVTKTDGGKFVHGSYKTEKEAQKWIDWYKTGNLSKMKAIKIIPESIEEIWGARKASGGYHGDKKFKKLKSELDPKEKDIEEAMPGGANSASKKGSVWKKAKKYRFGVKVGQHEPKGDKLAEEAKDIAVGKRISFEQLSKSLKDFWTEAADEKEKGASDAKVPPIKKDNKPGVKIAKIRLKRDKMDGAEGNGDGDKLAKKEDEVAILKQKIETEKQKSSEKATKKLINPETGEPLLQIGIAYKHIRDKLNKEKEKKKQEVKESEDYLRSKLSSTQIANIKATWKSKKASDVTQGVKDMIKKMDIPTQLAIKKADIPHISKLIESLKDDMVVRIKNIKMPPNTGGEVPNSIIVNVPAGKDPKEVGRGALKKITGKVPTSFDVVKETFNEGYEGTILAYLKKYSDKAYFSYRKLMVKKGSEGAVKTVLTRGVNDRASLIYGYELPPIAGVNEGKEDGKAYAIGMAKAKEKMNDEPPLEKKTIKKAHDIAKAIQRG